MSQRLLTFRRKEKGKGRPRIQDLKIESYTIGGRPYNEKVDGPLSRDEFYLISVDMACTHEKT